MKTIKNILVVAFLILLNIACNRDNIDPITPVTPGADVTAPVVTFKYPVEGTLIKVFEEVTSIVVKIEVTDDIEIRSISALMDGVEFAYVSSFMDYRIAIEDLPFDNLVDGLHKLTIVATDIEGKTTTAEVNFAKEAAYSKMFDGETFFMPFDGDYMNLIGFEFANPVGTPGFAGKGYVGSDAYRASADSYITYPAEGLLSTEFSAAFWYKVDPNPDRSGIIVVGADQNRTQGFRMFREGSATEQRIKLNVGTGTGESWNDGGVIDVTAGEWVHVAFSISQTKSTIFFNGVEQLSSELAAPIDWTGCENITIGSGGETFSYWNHKSDNSDMDELRFFDKALTASDIQIMMNSFNPYVSPFDSESFYMPFEGGFINIVGSTAATAVGSPEITVDAHDGDGAFLGATDSYITHTAEGLLSNQFSAAFWYKVNADPDRAGIITIGANEERMQGIRFFREGSGEEQRIKLNVGFGSGESWNDGDVIDATTGDWVHIAFTISDTKNTIYFNGVEMRSSDMGAPVDWTGCENIDIGSGGETFSYWDHKSDASSMDELRFFSKALTLEDVQAVYGGAVSGGSYTAKYDGETFFSSFDGSYTEEITSTDLTVVGTPAFAGESVVGSDAYAGTTDSYLSFPIDGLFNDQFSGAFWYKVNADPDNSGILTVAPPRIDDADDRTSGFRLFREGTATEQRIKLHLGDGSGDVWNDGDVIDVTVGEWVHIAFTVTETATQIYFNGVAVANAADMTGKTISWAGCENITIGSGAPNFIGWDHHSDNSYVDELRLFNKALSADEILTIYNDEL